MRPARIHRDLPVRSAFFATAFVTGRREAKMQMITTTGGKMVISQGNSVSTGTGLPRRDTPSSSLSSTDDEVAYLTGVKEPNYVRPVRLHPPLAPPPSARSRSHRSGRSSASRVSKGSRLTSASQRSLIDVNELVRKVLHQNAQIEERRTHAEQQRLQTMAQAERDRIEVAARAERERQQA